MTDTSTTDQAKSAASTAADEGKHVAGIAQEEAGNVASEAAAQARSVVDDAKTHVTGQVGDQARQQRDNLISTLGSVSNDLSQMADNGEQDTVASSVVREVAHHAQSLTSYLEGREPGELLEDVRDFARRRPGTFLLGALAAGVVAGRLARGVKDAPSGPTTTTGNTGPAAGPAGGTAAGYPVTTGTGIDSGIGAGTAPGSAGNGLADPVGTLPPPPAAAPLPPAPGGPRDVGLGTDAAGYGSGQDQSGGLT
jgi:hypothetical protein